MTSGSGTPSPLSLLFRERLVWVFIIPLALFLVLMLTQEGVDVDGLQGDHAGACDGCTFTFGDRRATANVTPQTASDMALNVADMPQGFELSDEHELTPLTQGVTDEERATSAQQGFITGRNRTFRRPTSHGTAEIWVHLTIYASSSGASWAQTENASHRPDRGKFVWVLGDLTLGDRSSVVVVEDRDNPDAVRAAAIFRFGNVSATVSQSSPRVDFDARQLIAVAYAQLAKIERR